MSIRVFVGALLVAFTAAGAAGQEAPRPSALEKFVGAYQLQDGTIARVMLRGDALVAESGLGASARLKAVSSDVFEGEGADRLRLEFLRGSGPELRVRVHQQTGTREGQRVEVPATTLARYVGRYPLSAELAMEVTLEGARLIAQATGASRHPLFPESATKFFVQDYQAEDVAELEFGNAADGAFVIFRQSGFERRVLRR